MHPQPCYNHLYEKKMFKLSFVFSIFRKYVKSPVCNATVNGTMAHPLAKFDPPTEIKFPVKNNVKLW